jgi:hypothetical protein
MPSDLPPSSPDPARPWVKAEPSVEGGPAASSQSEARTFEQGTACGAEPAVPSSSRPQADFGAPINVGGDDHIDRNPEPDPAQDNPSLAATGHETALSPSAEPRQAPVLTRRISQGMPSYFEPDTRIAGVVGRAARGGSRWGE